MATVFKLMCMTIFGAMFIYFAVRVIFWVWVTVISTVFGSIEDYFS